MSSSGPYQATPIADKSIRDSGGGPGVPGTGTTRHLAKAVRPTRRVLLRSCPLYSMQSYPGTSGRPSRVAPNGKDLLIRSAHFTADAKRKKKRGRGSNGRVECTLIPVGVSWMAYFLQRGPLSIVRNRHRRDERSLMKYACMNTRSDDASVSFVRLQSYTTTLPRHPCFAMHTGHFIPFFPQIFNHFPRTSSRITIQSV